MDTASVTYQGKAKREEIKTYWQKARAAANK